MGKVVKMKQADEPELIEGQPSFRIRDIPLIVTMGDLCLNVSMAFKIMNLIVEGKTDDAFWIASEILKNNSCIMDSQTDKEAIQKLLDKEFEERRNAKI